LHQRAALAMVLRVLKFIRSVELGARLPGILKLFRELRGRRGQKLALLEMILRYVATAAGQLDETTLRAALREALPIEVEESVMPTIAETWEARGKQQGQRKHAQDILQRQLAQRFGALSAEVIQRIETAELDTLDRWLDQVLTAPTLAAVFDET